MIAMSVLFILTIGLIYGIIHNTFLKHKNTNNEYFITNKRIAVYIPQKGFKIKNISDIEHIGISREKNEYGDITFNFYSNDIVQQLKNNISFEGVKDPRQIVEKICELNNKIHVYDDRPTIMGEKL